MGLFTNLPFALASGLGLNAVVAFDLILGRGLPWQVAMACVVIEGVVALVLVLVGLREAIMRAVPMEIKLSIGVGIGLFIALVGFRDAGITINNDATGIGLGILTGGPPMIALAGLLTMIVLTARGFHGAILVGIIVVDGARPDLRSARTPGQGGARSRAAATSRRSATRSPRATSPTPSRGRSCR